MLFNEGGFQTYFMEEKISERNSKMNEDFKALGA